MSEREQNLAARVGELEAMIEVAIGYLKAGNHQLAAIVLIGSKGFEALQQAEREAADTERALA